MENIVTFQVITNGAKTPNGYWFVNCHMVFDIKIEDFMKKAHLVVGDHVI